MSTQPKTFLSPQEYLEIERKAEHKSEYYAGGMFAMAGAQCTPPLCWTHNFAGGPAVFITVISA